MVVIATWSSMLTSTRWFSIASGGTSLSFGTSRPLARVDDVKMASANAAKTNRRRMTSSFGVWDGSEEKTKWDAIWFEQ